VREEFDPGFRSDASAHSSVPSPPKMNPSGSGERRSLVALLIAPAAIVVAGALLVLRLYFQPPTVPVYSWNSPVETAPLVSGSRFEADIRPAQPVIGAIGARAFLLRDGEVRPWDPPFEVARDGSVRLAGPVATLFAGVPAGDWEIDVAVGRPETLPTAPSDVLRKRAALADDRPAAWRLVRAPIRLGSK